MTDQPQIHPSIVAMISLASGIASRHPDMGLCQLERLRGANIPEHQIDAVIEIARHIREEASEKVDAAFDEKARIRKSVAEIEISDDCRAFEAEAVAEESCACTPTPGGQSCC